MTSTLKNTCLHAALAVTWGAMACGQAFAQTRLADQAINCSAVFSIFSEVYAQEPSLAAKFGKAVDIFTEVYLKEHPQASTDLSNAVKRRAAAVQEFRRAWASRADYFRENAVICGAWAEGFLGQGERYQFVPVYPKVVASQIRLQYQAYADEAIQRWQP